MGCLTQRSQSLTFVLTCYFEPIAAVSALALTASQAATSDSSHTLSPRMGSKDQRKAFACHKVYEVYVNNRYGKLER
jgi:hypothetical protein